VFELFRHTVRKTSGPLQQERHRVHKDSHMPSAHRLVIKITAHSL